VNVVVPFPDPLPSSLVSGPSLKIDKFAWERPRPRNRANIAVTLDDDLRLKRFVVRAMTMGVDFIMLTPTLNSFQQS
jgi:hypothetical protein